jgi:hypothetical protein
LEGCSLVPFHDKGTLASDKYMDDDFANSNKFERAILVIDAQIRARLIGEREVMDTSKLAIAFGHET